MNITHQQKTIFTEVIQIEVGDFINYVNNIPFSACDILDDEVERLWSPY